MENLRNSSYHGLRFEGNMGNITCNLYLASFFVLPSFSIFLLVAIAVDRFYAVFRPLDKTPISRNIKIVILILWTCSLISPTAVFTNQHLETKNTSYFCQSSKFMHIYEGKQFHVISLTLTVVIPLTLLAILYMSICIKLCHVRHPEREPVRTNASSKL